MENNLGEMVRYHRKQRKLSQLDLADIAGVGKTVVFDIEKGKPTVQLDSLTKVLDVLQIQITYKAPGMTVQWKK